MIAPLLAAMLLQAAPTVPAADLTVEVFTTQDLPVRMPVQWTRYQAAGYRVVVFHVDAFEDIEAELSEGLPADEAKARAILERRLAQDDGRLRARMQKAGLGIERAIEHRLSEYPAIVFGNGTAVVYGERDLAKAIAAYDEARGVR